MHKQDCPQASEQTPTGMPTRTGAIGRFLNAIRRWEEVMDRTPYDCMQDRIDRLEDRLRQLERAHEATDEIPPQSR